MPRIALFANPIAGAGQGRIIAERLASRLLTDGHSVEQVYERPDDVEEERLCDAAAAIAIGGDGTIRAVAARLYRASPQKPVPLLVVPMGTANLLGKHLGLRWNKRTIAEQVSRAIGSPRIVELDAAQANGEVFLLMAGIGLDAQVVHELNRMRTGPIDYTSYVLPAALALGTYAFPPLTVMVNDKVIASDLPSVAFVGNVREYGTGFPILPHARPDDSLLDVCILPCANLRDLALHLLRAVAGEHLAAEGAIYTKGRRIRVESPASVPVQIDGDPAG